MSNSVTPSGSSPEWLRVLRQRQVVHDGDVNKSVGVVDDGQDGGEVVGAAAGGDLGRRTLQDIDATVRNTGPTREDMLS